ncbi:thioredoxin domain-containing protein [Vibrio astriarenae]|uniref:Thioredoxin domain-containing protein n=1 Tax=Vibrio astriarenae TaxID=1481923 RepID=A0A7Z2T6L2_9VIBR|nr:thioredoxin domain-containing protein [Vibrio astriarenae]QIA65286.1 thioredoxin domain-containing protein [Vibrio astriarenae]
MTINFPKFSLIALLTPLFILAGCSEEPTTPSAGKEYQQLAEPLSNLAPVTEVFSLTCGHCRSIEAFIPELEQATNQEIGKVHVTFNESAQIAAMIYYTAVMQSDTPISHSTMDELFAAVQMMGQVTQEEQKAAIESVFESNSWASPYQIDDQQQSEMLALFQEADDISIKGRINSVPTFIINGQYQVNVSAHEDIQSIANTINYLLNKE